jgi:hypothetical protein
MYINKDGCLIPLNIESISPAEITLIFSINDEKHTLLCREEKIVYVRNVPDELIKRIKVKEDSLEKRKEQSSMNLNYIGTCFLLSRLTRYIKDKEMLDCIETALDDFIKTFPDRFSISKKDGECVLDILNKP